MTAYESVADGLKKALTHPAGAVAAGLGTAYGVKEGLDHAYMSLCPFAASGWIPDMDRFMAVADGIAALGAGTAVAAGLIRTGIRRRRDENHAVVEAFNAGLSPEGLAGSTGYSNRRIERILARAQASGDLTREYRAGDYCSGADQ
ncbi:MAG: hypothetical protein FJY76_02095 [Candidatus Aenigmarchaeota archaeon]|nr:hypothetical protein [Candidatus Aenigmarchaeota archaeon]